MNDGGPAFPQWDGHAITSEPQYLRGGMSLRDYFAAKALTGILSGQLLNTTVADIKKAMANSDSATVHQCLSAMAYDFADAMLNARCSQVNK